MQSQWVLPVQLRERAFLPTEAGPLFEMTGLEVLHIWGGTAGNWGRFAHKPAKPVAAPKRGSAASVSFTLAEKDTLSGSVTDRDLGMVPLTR